MRVKKTKTIKNVLLMSCVLSVTTANTSIAQATNVEMLESRVNELERLLKQQVKTQSKQDKKLLSIAKQTQQKLGANRKSTPSEAQQNSLSFYGSFRPAVTYTDNGTNSSSDITDFFSRVGIMGELDVNTSVQAFFRGEWDVDIEDDADFGDARLGYVGLGGEFGRVAIGKQWHPHYNIVAEVTDIFNNRASAFAYDQIGPFRTNNMATYRYKNNRLKFDAGVQIDGTQDGVNHVDIGSVGIAYSSETYYVGTSYLRSKGSNNYQQTLLGLAASITLSDSVYMAMTYQDTETNSDLQTRALQGKSLDVVLAYTMVNDYTLKSSYFQFDDGVQGATSTEHDGINITLEKQLTADVKVFTEWLRKDFTAADETDALSIGVRYDFSVNL